MNTLMTWRTIASFTVLGDPKPQPRPRAFARGKHARVYDPATAEGWKSAVALAAREHLPPEPLQGPVRLDAIFRFRRPKKHYIANKPERGLRVDAPQYHTGLYDADNLIKAVMDTLTTIGMWADDGQVCECAITKIYSEQPGAEICLESPACTVHESSLYSQPVGSLQF